MTRPASFGVGTWPHMDFSGVDDAGLRTACELTQRLARVILERVGPPQGAPGANTGPTGLLGYAGAPRALPDRQPLTTRRSGWVRRSCRAHRCRDDPRMDLVICRPCQNSHDSSDCVDAHAAREGLTRHCYCQHRPQPVRITVEVSPPAASVDPSVPGRRIDREHEPMTEDNPATPAEARRARYDELLAAAVEVLTEAARLQRPVLERDDAASTTAGHAVWAESDRSEPIDWAEFVTLALAGAAANIGGIDAILAGRPGSWEADGVRHLLTATVGHDEAHLMEHRTKPVVIDAYVDELLVDLGAWKAYDDAQAELIRRYDGLGIPPSPAPRRPRRRGRPGAGGTRDRGAGAPGRGDRRAGGRARAAAGAGLGPPTALRPRRTSRPPLAAWTGCACRSS